MGKYKSVCVEGFESEDDFHYILKLLETTGWTYIWPPEMLMMKVNWKKVKINSSPQDPHRLYVTDGDDNVEKTLYDKVINIRDFDKHKNK